MSTPAQQLTPETAFTCTINGRVVRSMGIQRFLDNCAQSQFSNIDFFASQQKLEHRWHECNMGCHEPAYRTLQHDATYAELLNNLTKIDPTKGYAVGLASSVVQTTERIGLGTVRTGEGLGLGKDGRVAEIGLENSLAFELAKDALIKAFSMSLTLVDNPFTAMIIKVVSMYMNYVPDDILIKLAVHGKYKNLDIDINMAIEASVKGLTNIDIAKFTRTEIEKIGSYLNNNPQLILKQIGKYQGRKLATLIATHIAISIAKKIALSFSKSPFYKNTPKSIVPGRNAKGLAGVLIALLKTQGMLQAASNASHRLHSRSPKLWRFLRSRGGYDLIYFFAEDYLKEYVDRIGLAERNPVLFIEMIAAILKPPGNIKDVFFPFRKWGGV